MWLLGKFFIKHHGDATQRCGPSDAFFAEADTTAKCAPDNV